MCVPIWFTVCDCGDAHHHTPLITASGVDSCTASQWLCPLASGYLRMGSLRREGRMVQFEREGGV